MEKLYVIKIGGKVIEDQSTLTLFLNEFTNLNGSKILIHGGGRSATRLGDRLGIKTEMINGRRVTDEATIELISMVYAGSVNKMVVANLQANGVNALGLSGVDGDLVRSGIRGPFEGIDYGLVGDPVVVNSSLLTSLLNANCVPVIAPLTHDGKGQLLNLNADTMTTVVATSLTDSYDVSVVFAFEHAGVLTDMDQPDSLVRKIDPNIHKGLVETQQISGGMLPKIKNSFDAIDSGVKDVRICHFGQIGSFNDAGFQDFTLIHG